jgi:hypothetical protein
MSIQQSCVPVKVKAGPQVGLSATFWPNTIASISSTKPIAETSPMAPGRM